MHGSNRHVKLLKCVCCASQVLTAASSLQGKILLTEGVKVLLTQLRRKHKDKTMTSLCEGGYWRFRIAPALQSLQQPGQWQCSHHACALSFSGTAPSRWLPAKPSTNKDLPPTFSKRLLPPPAAIVTILRVIAITTTDYKT